MAEAVSRVLVANTLAHRCGNLRLLFALIGSELEAFGDDPAWRPLLLRPPELLGVTAKSPRGLTLEVLLVTEAGAQGAAARELRLRLLERLRQRELPLAENLDAAS